MWWRSWTPDTKTDWVSGDRRRCGAARPPGDPSIANRRQTSVPVHSRHGPGDRTDKGNHRRSARRIAQQIAGSNHLCTCQRFGPLPRSRTRECFSLCATRRTMFCERSMGWLRWQRWTSRCRCKFLRSTRPSGASCATGSCTCRKSQICPSKRD